MAKAFDVSQPGVLTSIYQSKGDEIGVDGLVLVAPRIVVSDTPCHENTQKIAPENACSADGYACLNTQNGTARNNVRQTNGGADHTFEAAAGSKIPFNQINGTTPLSVSNGRRLHGGLCSSLPYPQVGTCPITTKTSVQ